MYWPSLSTLEMLCIWTEKSFIMVFAIIVTKNRREESEFSNWLGETSYESLWRSRKQRRWSSRVCWAESESSCSFRLDSRSVGRVTSSMRVAGSGSRSARDRNRTAPRTWRTAFRASSLSESGPIRIAAPSSRGAVELALQSCTSHRATFSLSQTDELIRRDRWLLPTPIHRTSREVSPVRKSVLDRSRILEDRDRNRERADHSVWLRNTALKASPVLYTFEREPSPSVGMLLEELCGDEQWKSWASEVLIRWDSHCRSSSTGRSSWVRSLSTSVLQWNVAGSNTS